jgi:signal transduction histidine kinase
MTRDDGPAWNSGRAIAWYAVGIFACLAVAGVALSRSQPNPHSLPLVVTAAVVATIVSVPLAMRRPPLLLYGVACAAGIVVICNGGSPNVGWLAVNLIGGWCALVGGFRVGLAYWLGAMALFGAEWWISPDVGWSAWLAASTLTFLLGLLLRRQLELVERLRAAQVGLAEKSRAEERNRIARDLHDVIAHTLTVSLLHVMSAQLAVEHDPADAARSLAEAERLGRESLAEVRTVVGILRKDGDMTQFAPPPGADGLAALVERFQLAGGDVTLLADGNTADLPATVGLALYRILQEALTNVVKHAPGSATVVRLAVDPAAARLSVHSMGEPAPGTGSGLGVMSMRERAESIGGRCEAGPANPGWAVRASFPLSGQSPAAGPAGPAGPTGPETAA